MKKNLSFLCHNLLKCRILFTFCMVMICLLSIQQLQAQVPQAFKYQAVARDNTGAIIANQNVSFRMSVIQGTLPGTVVYSETHNVTTNEFGLATLEIGKGTPVSGTFSTIDWNITPDYIKTELDPAGGSSYVNMGTSELLSVPYALQAGYAPDDDWVVSGSNLYPAVNGNVGLGVATPTQKLHVNGNMRLTGGLYDKNNQIGSSGQVLSATGTQVDWITLPSSISGSGLNNKLAFWTGSGTLGYDDILHWSNTSQQLGIGTTSPYAKLHLYNGPGGGGGTYNDIYDLIIEDDAQAYIGFNGAEYNGIAFNDDNEIFHAGILYNSNTDILGFRTGDTDFRLAISETGNVGIGTASPTQNLHVNGNMRLTGALYDANNTAGTSGQILSTTGTGADWIDNPSLTGTGVANKVAFWTGAGTLDYNSNFHWDNTNDHLGIGISTPSYKLHIAESTDTRGIFVTNSANADGNVGIFITQSAMNNATNHVAGVYGRASGLNQPNSYGVVGHNYFTGIGIGAWSYGGDLIRAYNGDWPGGLLKFYITNNGNAYVDGSWLTFKGVASKGPNQHVAMAATQSPEALMEDCGSADLVNGAAVVPIDETFAEIANTGSNYQVFLTPVSEDIVILVVSNKTAYSFAVKGVTMDGKSASCSFDYRIVARDNESKGGRFEKVDIPEPIEVPREE